MAGYNIKGVIDFDEDSLKTAKTNNLADHYLNIDLFNKNWLDDLIKKITLKEIDIGCRATLPRLFINGPKKIR